MTPIVFHCTAVIPAGASTICSRIADTTRWSDFRGYGILPGIKCADYETKTREMVGSRIRVCNTDGSGHVEEIVTWVDGSAVGVRLQEFVPPLSHLATHIDEAWSFQPEGSATRVTRTMHLYPRRSFTRPALWLISLLLRKAIALNLTEMADAQ